MASTQSGSSETSDFTTSLAASLQSLSSKAIVNSIFNGRISVKFYISIRLDNFKNKPELFDDSWQILYTFLPKWYFWIVLSQALLLSVDRIVLLMQCPSILHVDIFVGFWQYLPSYPLLHRHSPHLQVPWRAPKHIWFDLTSVQFLSDSSLFGHVQSLPIHFSLQVHSGFIYLSVDEKTTSSPNLSTLVSNETWRI